MSLLLRKMGLCYCKRVAFYDNSFILSNNHSFDKWIERDNAEAETPGTCCDVSDEARFVRVLRDDDTDNYTLSDFLL